jgi:hypothetical protein
MIDQDGKEIRDARTTAVIVTPPKKVREVITKEEYERVKAQYLADKEANKDKKPKTFNSFFKWGKRATMNKSLKKNDEILVFLLNLKKNIEGPILTKIYGGNFLVIRNHVYRFNPDRVFSFGKYKAVIAREYDRELVGIDDYEELVRRDFISKNPGGRVNIDDPVLIKALIAAKLSEKPAVQMSIGKWILIGLVVLGVIVGFFLISSKKTPQPAQNATTPQTNLNVTLPNG